MRRKDDKSTCTFEAMCLRRLLMDLMSTSFCISSLEGEAQTIKQLWEEYFADPSQWWDNRVDKSNPRSLDFKHKVTRKALSTDGCSNPPWVKAMLKSVTQGKLQLHVGYDSRGSHGTAQPKRSWLDLVALGIELCPPCYNIDEDKELALCYHNEKLAIAYGLMRTAPGNRIRIYKNLRVCSDCHTATKVICKVTGREIVARDANRFHHFKDGMCSCSDYW